MYNNQQPTKGRKKGQHRPTQEQEKRHDMNSDGSISFLQQQSQASPFLYAPYAIWPIGLSSSMPGAIKFVRGSPVSLAAEQRAIVGELDRHSQLLSDVS
jgi:hypothetical protein